MHDMLLFVSSAGEDELSFDPDDIIENVEEVSGSETEFSTFRVVLVAAVPFSEFFLNYGRLMKAGGWENLKERGGCFLLTMWS